MCKGVCGKMKGLAWVLVIVGGLNWLLVGIFDWDLVSAIFGGGGVPGAGGVIATIIYILVGLAALWLVFGMKCGCKMELCCASETCTGEDCKDENGQSDACSMCGESPCVCGDMDDESAESLDEADEIEDKEESQDHGTMSM